MKIVDPGLEEVLYHSLLVEAQQLYTTNSRLHFDRLIEIFDLVTSQLELKHLTTRGLIDWYKELQALEAGEIVIKTSLVVIAIYEGNNTFLERWCRVATTSLLTTKLDKLNKILKCIAYVESMIRKITPRVYLDFLYQVDVEVAKNWRIYLDQVKIAKDCPERLIANYLDKCIEKKDNKNLLGIVKRGKLTKTQLKNLIERILKDSI